MPTQGVEAGEIVIATPQCERGLGKVIQSASSKDLIEGVRIQPFAIYPDDRGYFLEVARAGMGIISGHATETLQVSAALSYPGTIKAFHFHRRQTDLWCPVMGVLQVALVDLREGSPTFGLRNTMYVGPLRSWQVLIPPGVGHGYKVAGTEAAMLVYVTDRYYYPSDEGRIGHNDAGINYDWEIQHK